MLAEAVAWETEKIKKQKNRFLKAYSKFGFGRISLKNGQNGFDKNLSVLGSGILGFLSVLSGVLLHLQLVLVQVHHPVPINFHSPLFEQYIETIHVKCP